MTAPLNGLLLNGGTPYATWAWGWSRTEATATAKPVIHSVHRYVDGEAHGEAVSTGITDRLAFLNGEEQPYADTAMAATRYAYVNAQALALTDATITPVRTAWFDSSTLNIEAVSSAYAERWKIFTAQIAATAETNNVNNRVYRGSLSKNIPGQARSWVAESLTRKIRVRQIYVKSDAVARSRSRVLANTALGFGDMQLDAVVSLDSLKTSIYCDYRGLAYGEGIALIDPSRIRIIEGGMPCEATIHAAPTITTATGRYSYNTGLCEAETLSQATDKILRRVTSLDTSAISEWVRNETYLVHGVAGSERGTASTVAYAGSFTRVRASKEQVISAAVSVASFNRYRWTPVSVIASEGQAVSYSTNSAAAYSNEVTFSCYALTEANYAVERWQDSVAFSDGESTAVNVRLAGFEAKPAGVTGAADITGEATRIAYLDSITLGEAVETVVNIRTAYLGSIISSEAAGVTTAERTAWMSDSSISIDSDASLVATRYAPYNSTSTAEASESNTFVRFAYHRSTATSQANVISNPTRYAYPDDLTPTSSAASSAEAHRSAWFTETSSLLAEGISIGGMHRAAGMQGTSQPSVGINCGFTVFHWEYFEGQIEAEAEEYCDGLRWTFMAPEIDEGVAVGMKFVYQINAGSAAPDERVMFINRSNRMFMLGGSNREYIVQ